MNPRTLTLYHGTGSDRLDGFLKERPRKKLRGHLPKHKEAFCTSLSLDEAVFFALRKTPTKDLSKVGIVLEFIGFNLILNEDYILTCDNRAIRNEHEVAVFNVEKLKLIAVWRYQEVWKRTPINEIQEHKTQSQMLKMRMAR